MSSVVDRIRPGPWHSDWRIFGFTAAAGIVTAVIQSAPRAAIRAGPAALVQPGAGTRRRGQRRPAPAPGAGSAAIGDRLVVLFAASCSCARSRTCRRRTPASANGASSWPFCFGERAYPIERRREAFRTLDERIKAIQVLTSAARRLRDAARRHRAEPELESDRHISASRMRTGSVRLFRHTRHADGRGTRSTSAIGGRAEVGPFRQ